MKIFSIANLILLVLAIFNYYPRPKHCLGNDQIVLVTQIFLSRQRLRNLEIFFSLVANLNNKHIDKIILVQDYNFIFTNGSGVPFLRLWRNLLSLEDWECNVTNLCDWIPKHWEQTEQLAFKKIILAKTHTNRNRIFVNEAFRAVSDVYGTSRQAHPYVMLSNADIVFDNSLSSVKKRGAVSPHSVHFISRYELDINYNSSRLKTQCGPAFIGSADVLAFRYPFPKLMLENLNFPMGVAGAESRLLWEFENAGYIGTNPCKTIRTWHIHSHIQASAEPQEGYLLNDKKSSICFPDYLSPKIKLDYPWELKKLELNKKT